MHDDIKLSYLGLAANEVRVLKSIFTLAPQLSEKFNLVQPKEYKTVDVFLVDADDPEVLQQWRKIKQVNSMATGLMVSKEAESSEGDVVLQRPIRVQRLIAALDDIMKEQTQFNTWITCLPIG